MKSVSIVIVSLFLLVSCQDEEIIWRDIPLPADRTAIFPFLSEGNDGILLSWIETVQDTVDILKVAEGDSLGFYSVTEVSRGSDWFVNWADFPKISQFTNGKYITHWLQKSSTSTYDYNIHIAIGEFGARIPDTVFILHDDGINAEHGFVSFLPYEDRMMVTWLDGRDTKKQNVSYGQMTLRSAIMNSDGIKIMEQEIDDRVCDCCQTDMAMVSGRPMVVYRDRSVDEIRDNYYAVFDGEGWSEGRPIHNDGWKIPGCPVNGPAISGGKISGAAAWYTEADQTGKVLVATFSPDLNAFSDPISRIDSTIGRVDIKSLSNGSHLYLFLEKIFGKSLLKFGRIDNRGVDVSSYRKIDEMSASRESGFPHIVIYKSMVYICYTSTNKSRGLHLKAIPLDKI